MWRNAGTALVVVFANVLGACAPASDDASNGVLYDAWRAGRSHLEVTASGSVARILGEREGPSGKHLGFIMHLSGSAGRGLTVRVEDNLDLTGPVPIGEGETVTVRGEYIFDAGGGVIHYTHRDPRGRHAAGYVEASGRIYQ